MNRVPSSDNQTSQESAGEIERLLQAIQLRTSGGMKVWMDNEPPFSRPLSGRIPEKAGSELADAFELDIHDCSSSEVNR